MANPKVFFDMTVDSKPAAGRIVMELFADTTPRTAENFRALCTGEKGIGKFGKPLHYKGSCNHSVSPKLMLCGGDLIVGDGTRGESIYGETFEDENFIKQHTGPGILSMSNGGPNAYDSRFMICMRKYCGLDDVHVVFGQVVEGLDVLKSIMEDVGTDSRKPSKTVVIVDCGEIFQKT
ncbi:PREDICTED: peptidyl-prolyl cis-trans isomerase CYP19-1-like isoform X2 [Camelina sativa]|uniref:Peptidyl-prolyl cis-trans isomerase n=1 Tax=Camelina sativa TaxID=90675 RepID=A0ABM1RCG5_CAMSA|nr:PREDICTED: peptidyl-prolyl cis-trans isomerase CYP19-1-like isoform X2 [Camelina sativa]